jgi:hypothetical protein
VSGSNVVAVKRELFRRLSLEAALTGVQISYAWKRDVGRELLYGGTARINHSLAAMRGGSASRLPRDEQVTLRLHIQVRNPQSDAAAAEERVMELLTVVEELLAGDPTLAGFPDLLLAGVSGIELAEPAFDDDGVTSGVGVEVSYRSYLT